MTQRFDWVIVGAGPAGQKAAIQAAKAGYSVAIVERGATVGGECVHRGTIPSKALRESAASFAKARELLLDYGGLPSETPMTTLLGRVTSIVEGHVGYQTNQVERNGIVRIHGQARFKDAHHLFVQGIRDQTTLTADHFVIATGSVPRHPPGFPIDHESILDSDSILGLPYVPERLVVVGGGVVACEYATVFQRLGTEVTLIDKASRPLGFMDSALTDHLVQSFQNRGGQIRTETTVVRLTPGFGNVELELLDGSRLNASTVLVALGRIANVRTLGVRDLQIEVTKRGHIAVDDQFRTSIPHILAVGDAIGFPALAATSMEQGRLAVRMALGLRVEETDTLTPIGIYTLPELAGVGLTEEAALAEHDRIRVGMCDFTEVARGQITGQKGLLKMITTVCGSRILGIHVAGEGAAELVHLGQIAMIGRLRPEAFVDNIFNFPTLAEAYRVAALALHKPTAVRSALVTA